MRTLAASVLALLALSTLPACIFSLGGGSRSETVREKERLVPSPSSEAGDAYTPVHCAFRIVAGDAAGADVYTVPAGHVLTIVEVRSTVPLDWMTTKGASSTTALLLPASLTPTASGQTLPKLVVPAGTRILARASDLYVAPGSIDGLLVGELRSR